MSTILISARGQYVVISEDRSGVSFPTIKEAIQHCYYTGVKFMFGWEE